jgi:hypothetical protein
MGEEKKKIVRMWDMTMMLLQVTRYNPRAEQNQKWV